MADSNDSTHAATVSTLRGGPTVVEVEAARREKDEPTVAGASLPMGLLVVSALVGLIAAIAFLFGLGSPDAGDFSKGAARLMPMPDLTPEQLVAREKKRSQAYYENNCASCHQNNGEGDGANFPPLAASDYVTGDAERLISIVHLGVTGPITVRGKTYSAQAMAAYGGGAVPSDKEMAGLLTYVRSAWGNSASAVSPEQVAFAREALSGRSEQWTEAELKAYQPHADFPALPEPVAGEAAEADAKSSETPDKEGA